MYPMRRRTSTSSRFDAPRSSCPSTLTEPSCGERSPPASVRTVVLPEPEGPVRITISPAATSVVTSNRICLRRSPEPK